MMARGFTRLRPPRQFARDESGTTLVEFAVVLPLFLLFVFAMIDFGRMGFEYVLANKAVQSGAVEPAEGWPGKNDHSPRNARLRA